MRIRFIRDYKLYRKGQAYDMNKLKAWPLVKRGIAVPDKMLDRGYRTK